MSNGEAICLNPRTPAVHVDVRPGGEIVVKGSFYSAHDGSTIDAAATIWPENAPGGASADSGGLIDFAAGGFRVSSRDFKNARGARDCHGRSFSCLRCAEGGLALFADAYRAGSSKQAADRGRMEQDA